MMDFKPKRRRLFAIAMENTCSLPAFCWFLLISTCFFLQLFIEIVCLLFCQVFSIRLTRAEHLVSFPDLQTTSSIDGVKLYLKHTNNNGVFQHVLAFKRFSGLVLTCFYWDTPSYTILHNVGDTSFRSNRKVDEDLVKEEGGRQPLVN